MNSGSVIGISAFAIQFQPANGRADTSVGADTSVCPYEVYFGQVIGTSGQQWLLT